MLLHLIFLLFVVCTAGICEIYSFSFLFLRVSDFLLLTTLVAYNNFSDTSLFISLSMSQVRGTCGHLKGKYDSHSSCLNCSACSRFNRCVECHSWSDSIWVVSWQKDGEEEGIQRETTEGLFFETLFEFEAGLRTDCFTGRPSRVYCDQSG